MSLSRVKNWIAEILNYADLNAEFDNILNNPISLISGASGSIDAGSWIFSQQPKDLLNGTCEGRLTLTSATPVTTSDVTAATTLYFTPYGGNRIGMYDGSNWRIYTFSEISIAVPATTDTMYDVWGYISGGSLALELLAWTNDTTRATAVAYQNGVLVKSGTTTRRLLGVMRTTGVSGQTEDSLAKRYVANLHNAVPRIMRAVDSGNSWTYTTATWRQANGGAGNQLDCVVPYSYYPVEINVVGALENSSTDVVAAVGIGVDSTSVNSAQITALAGTDSVSSHITTARYVGYPGVGRHYFPWLEYSASTGSATWYGDNGSVVQHGISGIVMG